MTEHLPECILPKYLDAVLWRRARQELRVPCICDELRACEQRVEESIDRAWEQAAQLAVAHARTATLDAAREAVAALDAYYAIEECEGNPLEKGDPEDPDPWHQGHLIERDDALAAIDALREDSDD